MDGDAYSALLEKGKLKAAPRNIRETFELLSQINAESSLETLLADIDWSEVNIHQMYGAFLDRLPEFMAVVRLSSGFEPKQRAVGFLASLEFQSRVIELLLSAYPEKRRLIHVHVPKTAGVDLREALRKKYPHIHDSQTDRGSTSAKTLLRHLSAVARQLQNSDAVFVTGHRPLSWYLGRNLYRYGDKMFSVVRNPQDSLLSLLNYFLQRIRECPSCTESNTRFYANTLGVAEFPSGMSVDEQRQLAKQMLYTEKLIKPSSLTAILGDGTSDSALERIVRSNIELIPLGEYNNYLRQDWGIESTTRANQSEAVLRLSDLDSKDLDYIQNACSEDFALYNRIIDVHQKLGGVKIFGRHLA